MSKMSMAEKNRRMEQKEKMMLKKQNAVQNFMGGISFQWNDLDTLKMVTASSIFGEPAYYRDGSFSEMIIKDGCSKLDPLFSEYALSFIRDLSGLTTSQLMEKAIDKALTFDFKATLEWAVILREDYYMRLNPQVIMVRAATHPARKAFTEANPNFFAEIEKKVLARADEPASQMLYYFYRHGSKAKLPSILKRSWVRRIESMSRYEIFKYRNMGVGLIDTVRVCHAKGQLVDELMRTGTVSIPSNEKTWETLRSQGKSWEEILDTISIGHMALLRNLHGIFSEISNRSKVQEILIRLKKGVPEGKQFPYRYYSAYQVISDSRDVFCKTLILDALEDCIDIACDNLPRLPGRTMCLSDNSGSAWGTMTSEYGTVRVAEIDNLSSVIAAYNSVDGTVGRFGDRLECTDISRHQGVLSQARKMSEHQGRDVGKDTECGIWLFFEKAIREKEFYDHIFIYSDMQAGHGRLYGTKEEMRKYYTAGFGCHERHIDIPKLIDAYRRRVNPKVNVFCIQTAGYDNVVIPENGYRTALLYGWTGKELVYADSINRLWDEKDAETAALNGEK